jgi:hypothetical protein
MPLIALDILENRIKELLMIVDHLKDENASLKSRLQDDRPASAAPVNFSPELMYELENLKKTVFKYKNDRNQLYAKLSGILKQVDEIINKG